MLLLQLLNVLVNDRLILAKQIAKLLVFSSQCFKFLLEGDVIIWFSIASLGLCCTADRAHVARLFRWFPMLH